MHVQMLHICSGIIGNMTVFNMIVLLPMSKQAIESLNEYTAKKNQ